MAPLGSSESWPLWENTRTRSRHRSCSRDGCHIFHMCKSCILKISVTLLLNPLGLWCEPISLIESGLCGVCNTPHRWLEDGSANKNNTDIVCTGSQTLYTEVCDYFLTGAAGADTAGLAAGVTVAFGVRT